MTENLNQESRFTAEEKTIGQDHYIKGLQLATDKG
jgi:hypothetical protein